MTVQLTTFIWLLLFPWPWVAVAYPFCLWYHPGLPPLPYNVYCLLPLHVNQYVTLCSSMTIYLFLKANSDFARKIFPVTLCPRVRTLGMASPEVGKGTACMITPMLTPLIPFCIPHLAATPQPPYSVFSHLAFCLFPQSHAVLSCERSLLLQLLFLSLKVLSSIRKGKCPIPFLSL